MGKTVSKKQKIIIISGPPAVGKTSVMINVIKHLKSKNINISAAKIDCLATEDNRRYESLGIPVITGLSEDICPDHFLAVNLEEIADWSLANGSDILIIETAGLCHRCAPFTEKTLSICVVDCLSSIKIPKKIGPMLTTADMIIVTKGDMVSQAEREVFIHRIAKLNGKAAIIESNGVSGFGSQYIGDLIMLNEGVESITGDTLRHPLPTAICSYCVGETRIGKDFQQGIVKKIDFSS